MDWLVSGAAGITGLGILLMVIFVGGEALLNGIRNLLDPDRNRR